MSDIIDEAKRELYEYDTFGSFWIGREVMAALIEELEAERANFTCCEQCGGGCSRG